MIAPAFAKYPPMAAPSSPVAPAIRAGHGHPRRPASPAGPVKLRRDHPAHGPHLSASRTVRDGWLACASVHVDLPTAGRALVGVFFCAEMSRASSTRSAAPTATLAIRLSCCSSSGFHGPGRYSMRAESHSAARTAPRRPVRVGQISAGERGLAVGRGGQCRPLAGWRRRSPGLSTPTTLSRHTPREHVHGTARHGKSATISTPACHHSTAHPVDLQYDDSLVSIR